ncbi:hypothetical protein Aab01nite_43670 [Paractinoplanes abujensis]|uniref:Uncharacterized protein n=1 Tax=Paractinoplanes abujensis TaxID=882441 RepID=A0A7W7CKJ9_9ACTN|nr:hypothetical protein [Actinoplanes abujensis]MBB4690004.1 hypothetical protein [Actinoplanes abujensis]GID20777.1 hypothetical protein Aab01nite_43670 [Actinoplanes abujensis]
MRRIPGFGRRPYSSGKRGRATFAGPPTHPLDLVKPPDYELDESWRDETKTEVGRLIDSLKPNALDAGTREVVHNFINARVLRSLKEIESLRAERRAIARVLVGMANEEVSRRLPGYEVDFARVSHARTAVADAYEKLTGRSAEEFLAAAPERAGGRPLHSTVGGIDLHLDDPLTWLEKTRGKPRKQGALRDPDMDLPADPDMPSPEPEGNRDGD